MADATLKLTIDAKPAIEAIAEVQELIRANDALRIAARAALDEYGRLEWMADHGWLEVEMHKLRRALEGGE